MVILYLDFPQLYCKLLLYLLDAFVTPIVRSKLAGPKIILVMFPCWQMAVLSNQAVTFITGSNPQIGNDHRCIRPSLDPLALADTIYKQAGRTCGLVDLV